MIKNITVGPLPSSEKTYIESEKFDDVKIAMRQINLSKGSEKKSFIVYDTSGIYTDPKLSNNIDLNNGLPKLRQKWIEERNDVEKYDGRNSKPEDNGIFVKGAKSSVPEFIRKNKEIMKKIIEIKDAEIEDGGAGAFYIYLKKK